MATAIIHLNNIRHNLASLKALAPAARTLAVIKANAYGHGAVKVAQALADEADLFGVARLEEADQLRALLPALPILVMSDSHSQAQIDHALQQGYHLILHSQAAVKLLGAARAARPVNVWLKVDTGMHRLGIKPEQTTALVQQLHACPHVNDIVLTSHFASADVANPQSYLKQLQLLNELCKHQPLPVTAANSAALLRDPETHWHWIRPGIALYGVNPLSGLNIHGHQQTLRTSMTLTAPIIAIRTIASGETVGYGDAWQAQRQSRIATVAIGYGDGYPRQCGNGTPTAIRGQIAPLAGRVSMDMIGVDVSDIPEAAVGDEVELWGHQISVDTIARCADTIPYELFCRINSRVKRLYSSD